jgi:hypothetical protein
MREMGRALSVLLLYLYGEMTVFWKLRSWTALHINVVEIDIPRLSIQGVAAP